jgi:hypothetical protein
MDTVTELNPPLVLEIETQHFTDVISILSLHGFRVVARADNPSRHKVIDEIPQFPRDGAA